ncbi:hypothetical protein [Streptomyces sp. NBC_01235]|uniref:hypothetical protein n=1 Tax=Streptomyces sp. NBC_01235 TaxID=2903788 RepID=UPI002E15EAC6|nr:hypothetical protein OG289_33460 [Streptomyces sp. NBC_01235]
MTHDGGDGETTGARPGRNRRRLWRWVVGAWVAAVAVGGGLTLWLQNSAEPPGRQPHGRHAPDESAAPLLHMDVDGGNPCDKAETETETEGAEGPDDEGTAEEEPYGHRIVVCAWPTDG